MDRTSCTMRGKDPIQRRQAARSPTCPEDRRAQRRYVPLACALRDFPRSHAQLRSQVPYCIPFFLHISRFLHRFIQQQQGLLRNSLTIAALRGGDDIAEQKEDFPFLDRDLDKMLNALEEDVRFLVGEVSVGGENCGMSVEVCSTTPIVDSKIKWK